MDQICMAISGENKGSVYLWDRTEAFEAEDYTNIPLIAQSFDEFMELLVNLDSKD